MLPALVGTIFFQERARALKRKHDLASTNALQPRSSGMVDLEPTCRSDRRSLTLLGSLASAITAMPKKIPTGSFMTMRAVLPPLDPNGKLNVGML